MTKPHTQYVIPILGLSLFGCEQSPPPESPTNNIISQWSALTSEGHANPYVLLDVDINLDGSNFCDVAYQIDAMTINADLSGTVDGAISLDNCTPEATKSGTVIGYTHTVSVDTILLNASYQITLTKLDGTTHTLALTLFGDALSGVDENGLGWSFVRAQD